MARVYHHWCKMEPLKDHLALKQQISSGNVYKIPQPKTTLCDLLSL